MLRIKMLIENFISIKNIDENFCGDLKV